MRTITAGLFMSLDGVVESPETWHFPYFNDEMGQAVASQMAGADTMLLGRRTYQEFAGYWPNQGDEVPMAAVINGTQKLVASTTLQSVEWQNSSLIEGDVAAELRRLKEQPGKNIAVTGSVTLVRSLLRAGVLDELHLLVHPIVLGHGTRLFEDASDPLMLKLIHSQTFRTGVLSLTYAPAGT
jgi:dihydrofolate reductase